MGFLKVADLAVDEIVLISEDRSSQVVVVDVTVVWGVCGHVSFYFVVRLGEESGDYRGRELRKKGKGKRKFI